MQGSSFVIAFAARRVDGETLLAHLEYRRAPSTAPGQPESSRRAALAKIEDELRTIERLAIGQGH
jgi:hypothetical protein